jgi:predicted nuclease with TOPRIM domain
MDQLQERIDYIKGKINEKSERDLEKREGSQNAALELIHLYKSELNSLEEDIKHFRGEVNGVKHDYYWRFYEGTGEIEQKVFLDALKYARREIKTVEITDKSIWWDPYEHTYGSFERIDYEVLVLDILKLLDMLKRIAEATWNGWDPSKGDYNRRMDYRTGEFKY